MSTRNYLSKPITLLTVGHLVIDISQGAIPILLPFLQAAFQLTYTQLGLIVLMQNLTSSVIQPFFGLITDKISLPWLIPASLLTAGIGLAAIGYSPSYPLLLLIIMINGIGVASFHPQASKSIHQLSADSVKGRSMGIFSVGGNAGMAIGSLVMTFLLTLPGSLSNTVYFLLPAGLLCAVCLINLKTITTHAEADATQEQQKKAGVPPLNYALLSALLLYIFIRSTIHTGLTTYLPSYYIHSLGGNPVFASQMISAFLFAGVAGTYAGGVLSDRIGRKSVIFFSMALSLPLLVLLPHTSGLTTLLLLSAIGFLLISSFATTVVLSQEMMPGYVGLASGLTTGFSIGLGGVGAACLGWIADTWGVPAIFVTLSLLPVAGLICIHFLPGSVLSGFNLRLKSRQL